MACLPCALAACQSSPPTQLEFGAADLCPVVSSITGGIAAVESPTRTLLGQCESQFLDALTKNVDGSQYNKMLGAYAVSGRGQSMTIALFNENLSATALTAISTDEPEKIATEHKINSAILPHTIIWAEIDAAGALQLGVKHYIQGGAIDWEWTIEIEKPKEGEEIATFQLKENDQTKLNFTVNGNTHIILDLTPPPSTDSADTGGSSENVCTAPSPTNGTFASDEYEDLYFAYLTQIKAIMTGLRTFLESRAATGDSQHIKRAGRSIAGVFEHVTDINVFQDENMACPVTDN